MKFRDLTPLGWAVGAAGLILAIVLLTTAWGRLWSWLPWSAESRADRAEQQAETAQSDAAARGLEVEGQTAIAGRVDTYHHQVVTIQTATAETLAEGRTAPDANEPLDPGRADRLRRHDASLCLAAPGVCPTAPAGSPE